MSHYPCPGKAGTVWGVAQEEVKKAQPWVWLSSENCTVSMLAKNADVSLVLEGCVWDSVFHPSFTSHWVSRRCWEPCMSGQGQGAVLECRRASLPACLPCEQLLARALPSELCPQQSRVPMLRGEGGEQRHRDTTASGLSLLHFRTPSCDSSCAVTPACVPGACHPCRGPGAGSGLPSHRLGRLDGGAHMAL